MKPVQMSERHCKAVLPASSTPGIALVAYSPLCCPGPQRDMKESDPNVLVDPVIKKIASKHNATVAQVLLYSLYTQCIIVY